MEEKKEEQLNTVDVNTNVETPVVSENTQPVVPNEASAVAEPSTPVQPVEVTQEPTVAEQPVAPVAEEPVQPVAPVQPVEVAQEPVQPVAPVTEEPVQPVTPVKTEVEVNEHPDAKIELNHEQETPAVDAPVEDKGNYKALKFAIIIGVIILAAIIILPKLIAKFLV